MEPYNWWLFVGGVLSALASIAHLCCIWGGAAWYRFFGAGERMARQVERGATAPTIITLSIAAMLAFWSIYAFSGAGVIPRLPLLRPGLVIITAVYLLRAAALPLMLRTMPDRSTRFLVWSSAIVFAIGLIHAVGLVIVWQRQLLADDRLKVDRLQTTAEPLNVGLKRAELGCENFASAVISAKLYCLRF